MSSDYTPREKLARLLWSIVQATLFRCSFRTWYGLRAFLLRRFGATLGEGCRFARTIRIECPWNLTAGKACVVGDEAILYCLGRVTLGDHVTISQYAHLCAGDHDYTKRSMPLMRPPITIGDEAWIAADAFVGPNVKIGARTVLGARACAFSDLPPEVVAVGNPARAIKKRELTD